MSAYEMMLSESQERMLMVLRPEMEAEAEAIFTKWGLDFAVVGRTTDDLRFRIRHGGREVANLPIKDLGDKVIADEVTVDFTIHVTGDGGRS